MMMAELEQQLRRRIRAVEDRIFCRCPPEERLGGSPERCPRCLKPSQEVAAAAPSPSLDLELASSSSSTRPPLPPPPPLDLALRQATECPVSSFSLVRSEIRAVGMQGPCVVVEHRGLSDGQLILMTVRRRSVGGMFSLVICSPWDEPEIRSLAHGRDEESLREEEGRRAWWSVRRYRM